MPPLFLLALVGAGCFAGYKLYSKLNAQADRVRNTAKDAARKTVGPRDLGELEWDAKAGVYRPRPDRKA